MKSTIHPHSSVGKESACNAGDLGSILGLENPLEKGKATHSSIMAWRIPWAVKSMGSQRIGRDWTAFTFTFTSLPADSDSKNLPAVQETWVWSLGQKDRSPGKGNSNPLQYSCLENPMDKGAWRATARGLARVWHNLATNIREGTGTPLQYSCLESPMDRGAWLAAVHGVAKSQTRLSDFDL